MAAAAFIRGATACGAAGGGPVVLADKWRFPWELCLAVIGLLLAMFLVLALLRRFVFHGAERAEPGMTMEQLDQLRDQGLISREEYRRARLALIPGAGEPERCGQGSGGGDPPAPTGPEAEEP